jgi:hypothetical protein
VEVAAQLAERLVVDGPLPAHEPAQLTIEQRLMTLKDLLNKGLIDEEEYKTRRQRILSELDRLRAKRKT